MKRHMIGSRFSRLVVTRPSSDPIRNSMQKWVCQCDCGNICTVAGTNLRNGHTRSCGCHAKELLSKRSKTHGQTHTKTYKVWAGMLKRCYNNNDQSYPNYGGRGIRVWGPWKRDFTAFIADMGVCPRGHTIERINNDADYAPGNCRWATAIEQANNKRNNIFVSIDGVSKTISQWAEHAGIKCGTMWWRVKNGKHGADLLRPVRRNG